MKYVNILLIGLVLLFPGCTFLDVVPEGNIESIESNFEKRDQTENWFKYCLTGVVCISRMVCSVRSIHTVICGVGMLCITVSVIVILFLKKCGEFII